MAEGADRGGDITSSGSPAHHTVYGSMGVRGYGNPLPYSHTPEPDQRVEITVKFGDHGQRVELKGDNERIVEDIAYRWQHTGGAEYRLDIGDKPEPRAVSDELSEMISSEARRLETEHPSPDRRVVTVSSIRVRLHPEHLGRMEIKVVKKGEEISAVIKAEDSSVRRLLHQIAPQIRRSLEQQGIKMGQVEIRSFNPSFSGGFGSWMGGERGFQQPGYTGYTAVMSQNEGLPYELEGEMEESSGVNLRA
ncbi:TPA: flagellar hook-length control protein FliK [Candidatus Poribacteria bacterium]|nr:flagellar hook-length control protein FliK [Candidatus Poribacteria bacterium]